MFANARMMRSISRVERAFIAMALISLAVILLPDQWLQTSYEFTPTHHVAQLRGDNFDGGNSEATWLNKGAQHWQCAIKLGAQDPYCSIQIHVTDQNDVGIDLSRYDKMTIWLDYQGDARYMRFYLRNRHPNYYQPDIDLSTKYNTIEVPVVELANGLELNMDDFVVAGWWLIGGNIPLEYSQPEFNEVSIIEVQTGSRVRSGVHQLQLKKIRWAGPLINQNSLYQGIIVVWSLAVLAMLAYRLIMAQREIKRQMLIQQELKEVNAALSLETRRFEELAKTDSLTGLLNRVGIRDILYRSVVDWRTQNIPFSFIIIDLDNFKIINDTHGHAEGDQVLVEAARLMLHEIRQNDALTRWGGEEFVLACPGCRLDQATQIAEKLRSTLEENLKCHGEPVTASFGVATMKAANLDKLFQKADKALYRAKKRGRNQVCSESDK